jgi:hypothetical protein
VAQSLGQAGQWIPSNSGDYFAPDSYATGATALFVAHHGDTTGVYLFTSAGNDGVISASELTLLATLNGGGGVGSADFVFGS